MPLKVIQTGLFGLMLTAAQPLAAAEIKTLTTADPLANLGSVTYPGGEEASFTVGFGSGAFRHPEDPSDQVTVISDRGPTFTCSAAESIIGPQSQPLCRHLDGARFYAMPTYSPSIYRLMLDRQNGRFQVRNIIPLRTASGLPVTGLLNPQTVARTDQAINLAGESIDYNADAVDIEGIVGLSDGSYWIVDEMAPSLLEVTPDGRIVKRLIPADAVADFEGADTEIVPSLPAILSKRHYNRGIESIAVTPDEKTLYFMLQNPLANPDPGSVRNAVNVRIFKMDRQSGTLVGEYIYQLDDPKSFRLDPPKRPGGPRISEIAALGPDRLLVLERTSRTTKLYEIGFDGATDILGSAWDDVTTSPSLEMTNNLAAQQITPVAKTLRFDTADDAPDAPVKLEGIAFLGDGSLVLINDNDFGISGEETRVLVIKGAVEADPDVYRR